MVDQRYLTPKEFALGVREWCDQQGYKHTTQLADELGIPRSTWVHLAAGNSLVSKKNVEYIARVYKRTGGATFADPRRMPPQVRALPHGGTQLESRAWTDEQLQAWLEKARKKDEQQGEGVVSEATEWISSEVTKLEQWAREHGYKNARQFVLQKGISSNTWDTIKKGKVVPTENFAILHRESGFFDPTKVPPIVVRRGGQPTTVYRAWDTQRYQQWLLKQGDQNISSQEISSDSEGRNTTIRIDDLAQQSETQSPSPVSQVMDEREKIIEQEARTAHISGVPSSDDTVKILVQEALRELRSVAQQQPRNESPGDVVKDFINRFFQATALPFADAIVPQVREEMRKNNEAQVRQLEDALLERLSPVIEQMVQGTIQQEMERVIDTIVTQLSLRLLQAEDGQQVTPPQYLSKGSQIDWLLTELTKSLKPYWDGTPEMRTKLRREHPQTLSRLYDLLQPIMLPPEEGERAIQLQKEMFGE